MDEHNYDVPEYKEFLSAIEALAFMEDQLEDLPLGKCSTDNS